MTNNYKLLREGKVRKIYEYDKDHLIIFTTDRISAFDVVLPDTIPGKGECLTNISNMWMHYLRDVIDNHLTDIEIDSSIFNEPGKAIVVKKLAPLPIEAIVRGYIIGSGWKEYQSVGMICDIPLRPGLKLAQKLSPIFTPTTKAEVGEHDESINFDIVADVIGYEKAMYLRDKSLSLYNIAADVAKTKGIIVADTKFEFGMDKAGKLYLIDEVLTPDSSRFWDANKYQVGVSPESYDKQIVRDYLEQTGWNKKPPAPALPLEIIEKTANRYKEVEQLLGNCLV